MTEPTINPYEASLQEADARKRSPGSVISAVVILGFAGLVLVGMLIAQQRCGRLIADFEIEPPLLTYFCLTPVIPMIFAVLILATLVKEFIVANHRVKRSWNFMLLAICLFLVLLFAIAFGLLLIKVTRALS